MEVIDTDGLVRQLDRLIQACPDMTKKKGVDYDLIEEGGHNWCEHVAAWTEKLWAHPIYGPRAQGAMNWYIRVLQPGKPARMVYDALVGMLVDGYGRIKEHASADSEIVGSIFGSQEHRMRKPASEFSEYAISMIQYRLKDPWGTPATFLSDAFPIECSSIYDPIIISNIDCLDNAMNCLDYQQRTIGIPRECQITELLNEKDGEESTELWLQATEQLAAHLEPPAEIQPEPCFAGLAR